MDLPSGLQSHPASNISMDVDQDVADWLDSLQVPISNENQYEEQSFGRSYKLNSTMQGTESKLGSAIKLFKLPSTNPLFRYCFRADSIILVSGNDTDMLSDNFWRS